MSRTMFRQIRSLSFLWSLLAVAWLCQSCPGTDRFFSDIESTSPSKRFKVEAKSPDNEPDPAGAEPRRLRRAFQSNFVFTCTEIETGKVLWTRKQEKQDYSPSEIFVTDDAWTVVYAGEELICIDPLGKERGKVDIIAQFSDEDRTQYVRHSTAGQLWEGNSVWYFLEFGEKHIFVIRPWWGRRVVIDVESGKPIEIVKELDAACFAQERTRVLGELAFAVETRKDWEAKGDYPNLQAVYLAGVLELKEAIPFLKQLEDCSFSGSSVWSSQVSHFDGRINPFNHSTYSVRQAVQLSLRRLGEVPRAFPITAFEIQTEGQPSKKFVAPALDVPRHVNASKVKKGMDAETVMSLLGEPDFVEGDGWEYDLDSKPPTTLVLTWGQPIAVQLGFGKEGPAQVTAIEKRTPAAWAQGNSRDRQLSE